MDGVNRQTARERPDLLEWRKCQGQAGWYGILAIVAGGSVSFAGLSVFPQLTKKYGVGAGCGWFVSYRVLASCRKALFLEAYSDGSTNQSSEKQKSTIPLKETKYGDKDFVKD